MKPSLTNPPSNQGRASPSSRLPHTIVVIGLVSLLNDFASEMVIPLIPLLLATVLAAGPVALGIIEGVADAVSNLLKLWAGRRSDTLGAKRKPFMVIGYALSNLIRPFVGWSGIWTTVLTIRVIDRVGKGLRTAPRDAMIADAVHHGSAGRAYGYARAMDHAGAVCGSLVAAAVVYWGTQNLQLVIALSAIPGLLAVGLIAFVVREPVRVHIPPENTETDAGTPLRWSRLSQPSRRYLLMIGCFMLGRIPETFLLLRGHELHMGVVELLLLWAALHMVKAGVSEFAGRRSDQYGRSPLILLGWGLYAIAIAGLAFIESNIGMWSWSLLFGSYFGLTEGAERALVRDLAPATERGTAFGWFHMIVGLTAIPAGLMLGGLWSVFGVKVAFLVSTGFAIAASVGFWRYVR